MVWKRNVSHPKVAQDYREPTRICSIAAKYYMSNSAFRDGAKSDLPPKQSSNAAKQPNAAPTTAPGTDPRRSRQAMYPDISPTISRGKFAISPGFLPLCEMSVTG